MGVPCHRLVAFAAASLLAGLFAAPTFGHDGVIHSSVEEANRHIQSQNTPGFPDIKGGDFTLVDHDGKVRTSADPKGRHQFLFFGYASCKAICSVALPRMISAVEVLEADGLEVAPLLITVDPERDTADTMADAVQDIHPKLIGLTGSQAALQQAYQAFQVEKKLVYVHPDEGPIYAHGSFIYLLGPDGSFKTLFPPVLSPERMAEIARTYIVPASN